MPPSQHEAQTEYSISEISQYKHHYKMQTYLRLAVEGRINCYSHNMHNYKPMLSNVSNVTLLHEVGIRQAR